jgi:enamine deaminase RidA (YjgF/YER057c/UK114 family)
VVTGGLIGWDAAGRFAEGFVGQVERVLDTTLAVLAEAGARPEHVVRQTWYVTSRGAYVDAAPALGGVWRARFGRHYPAMAVLIVAGLVEPAAMVEIETTAVIPDV